MSAFFSRYLDDSLKIDIAYIDRCTFYEFVESLDDPVCTYTFTITPPAGPAVLAYDPSVVKMLVTHELGGKVEGPLNAAECIVMDGVVARNLVHLAETWVQLAEMRFSAPERVTDRDRMGAAEPEDPIYLVAHDLECALGSGQVIVCYPAATIESLLPKLMGLDNTC